MAKLYTHSIVPHETLPQPSYSKFKPRTFDTSTESGPVPSTQSRMTRERGSRPVVTRGRSSAKSSDHNGSRRPAAKRESWRIQKDALSSKFGSAGWSPRKRLSPDALEGIRALHAQFPDKFSTPVLANRFEVSVEAIRRILKSKWRPSDEEATSRSQRWDKRGERIWGQMVALGVKPPKKWREEYCKLCLEARHFYVRLYPETHFSVTILMSVTVALPTGGIRPMQPPFE
ncbi:MAG: hypothetical protein Q9226_004706 [Calogaya cf. arnoldii]